MNSMTQPESRNGVSPIATTDFAMKASSSNCTFQRRPSLYDTIIHLKVGPEKIDFAVHKGLLCYQSGYFKAALSEDFKEGQENEIILDDEDLETVESFNEWLYTGKLPPANDKAREVLGYVLCKLYVFGEKRLVPELQNAIIDNLAFYGSDVLQAKSVRYVWINTAETSSFHSFLVEWYVQKANIKDLFARDSNVRELYPAHFVLEVAASLHRELTSGWPTSCWEPTEIKSLCKYHIHDDTHPILLSCGD